MYFYMYSAVHMSVRGSLCKCNAHLFTGKSLSRVDKDPSLWSPASTNDNTQCFK